MKFTKQYSIGNIFDVSIKEVLDKQIEIQKNYDDNEVVNNNNKNSDNRLKTTIFKYSYNAIVLILIEE